MTKEQEEIEVIDVSLNEHEIDEMIAQLAGLKEHKENVQIPIAADLDLSVTYDKDATETPQEDELNTEDSEDDGDDDSGDDGDEDNLDGNDIENSEKLEEVK